LEDRKEACSIASLIVYKKRASTLSRDEDEEAIENDTTSSLARAESD
jgi:hypothetical protein